MAERGGESAKMAESGGVGGGGGQESASTSPRNRVKFLCSHGGKILPRPVDSQLKYVGGETRVIAVPRDVNFSELMKRLAALIDGEIVLKYQITPEDLDALVSVRSDEDLKYMIQEHDRHETAGTPMLRTFLFPSTPVVIENQISSSIDPHPLEQRYVDALNGIIRAPPSLKLNPNGFSSACSSPKIPSPEGISHNNDPINQFGSRIPMHRVRSSPSLCSLSNNNNNTTQNQQQHHHQPFQYYQNHHHHHHSHHHHQSPRLPQEHSPQKSTGMQRLLVPSLSIDNRGYMGHGLNQYYPTIRSPRSKLTCE